jgi:hypothetical protein
MFVAAEKAPLLQRRDQPVDAGFGTQVQRVLHFLETGGTAGFPQMLVDKNQQFVLFGGEHGYLRQGAQQERNANITMF